MNTQVKLVLQNVVGLANLNKIPSMSQFHLTLQFQLDLHLIKSHLFKILKMHNFTFALIYLFFTLSQFCLNGHFSIDIRRSDLFYLLHQHFLIGFETTQVFFKTVSHLEIYKNTFWILSKFLLNCLIYREDYSHSSSTI
jgi:hypothetical protein